MPTVSSEFFSLFPIDNIYIVYMETNAGEKKKHQHLTVTVLIDLNMPLHSITHSNWFQSVHASNCESISLPLPRWYLIDHRSLTISKLVDSLKNVTIRCYPLLPTELWYSKVHKKKNTWLTQTDWYDEFKNIITQM